jgi:predicted nuclease of predicted toxin-antitoxin system
MGHDVHTVVDEALVGSSDERIWTRCQEEERLLVTQDLDFSDSRKFKPGRLAGPASESRSRRLGRLAEVDLRKVCRRKLEEVLCRRFGNEDPDSTELAFPSRTTHQVKT